MSLKRKAGETANSGAKKAKGDGSITAFVSGEQQLICYNLSSG
jgi:hypothetical protein